jgi:hypothetical protein
MSQLFVRLFNRGLLKQLVCTPSLIEGVNTIAKNVCIFDKTIDGRKNLNAFEFQNIRGRAGRMFQHYVGRIFLFNRPPDQQPFKLSVPAFEETEDAPDEMILQLRGPHTPEFAESRRVAIARDRILSERTLTNWSKYGVDNLEELAFAVWMRLEEGDLSLLWSGFGRYEEIKETYEFLWRNFRFAKENVTAGQFVHFINCFRRIGNVRRTLDHLIESGEGRFDRVRTIEGLFACLRGAEYTFANVLLCLQDIVRDVAQDMGSIENQVNESLDYSYFARELQNWFLPGALRGLDEYGVPLPLIIKYQHVLPSVDADAAMRQLRNMVETKTIVGIEAAIVRSAL